MAIRTFITAPAFSYPLQIDTVFNNLHSDYDQGDVQANRLWRFPKHEISQPITYKGLTMANRDLVYEFWRNHYGAFAPFWMFDPAQRKWYDEFLGYGGPIEPLSALQYTASGAIWTNYTEEAKDTDTNDVIIHPAAGSGNRFWIGSKTQFDKVTVVISQAGTGTYTCSFKYWNGSTLAALTVTDGTSQFKAAPGSCDIVFSASPPIPVDWVICRPDETILTQKNAYWICAEFDGGTVTAIPKATQITINSKTYDLPSKSTTNDGTLITKVNGVATTKTFVSGGGAGSADRVTFADYVAQGALVTADLQGYLRFLARFKRNEGDRFPDRIGTFSGSTPLYDASFPIEMVEW